MVTSCQCEEDRQTQNVIGAVALISNNEKTKMGEVEQKLIMSASGFLGRQMEQ